MYEILTRLFDPSGFPPRWNCGQWSSSLGWLHIISDLGIWAAYLMIPCVLAYFALKRRDLPFRRIFLLFVAFILLCGTTHLMEAIIFWWPAYRLAGVIKLITAIVSLSTVVALGKVTPWAMSMKSPEALEKEIAARIRAEDALQQANQELERRVQERMLELTNLNLQLAAERELFRVTLHSIGDAVIATDSQGQITFLNGVAQQLTGWSSGEAAGKPIDEVFNIINEKTLETVESPVRKVLEEGNIVGLANHTLLVHKDGHTIPIDDSGAPIRSGNEIVGVVLVFRDVSIRKQQEAQLQANELRLRRMAEAMPQIVWVTRSDGYRDYYNRRWYEFTGVSPEECLGWQWQDLLHPDDREKSVSRWRESLRTGEPFENEHRYRAKDGSYRWFLARALAVRDDDGQVMNWYGTCTDIEEFKRTADERERFFSLVKNSSEFIAICNFDGNPNYINPSGLRLIGLEELPEQPQLTFQDFLFAEDQSYVLNDFLPSVIEYGQGETEVRFKNVTSHDARWMSINAFVIYGTDGSREGLGTVSRDITERRRLEDHLRRLAADLSEADQRKDEFLATLAHELRNPLAPLRNGLQVLKFGQLKPEDDLQIREMMERQLGQMVRLVDDLLDVSRITRNKLELRREHVSLKDVLQNAVETSRPLINEFKHDLKLHLPDNDVYVDADFTRLSQVFANLLNNAAKYTEPGGLIELAVSPQAHQVIVSVKDNGVGIPAPMLVKIFEMFTQVDRTLERSQGGLGIGLTLVKRLVELHGGKVEASSAGHGHGSEFRVTLPLVASPRAFDDGNHLPSQRIANRDVTNRIMVVDDNVDSANSLALLLKMMGYDVRIVHDGLSAVDLFDEFQPTIVLLDIGLPKLNGYDACRRIRERRLGTRAKIIAITGWGQENDRRRSREAGFDAHLVKPIDPTNLERLLVSTLQS